MPPRFTVVSAPLEERAAQSLRTQAETALATLRSFVAFARSQKRDTFTAAHRVLHDDALLAHFATAAVGLLSPRSLPGALVLAALFLKFLHVFVVRSLAHRAIVSANSARKRH
tara:strand:+ start:72 stop:410 length:339 start_codon:yes stop_codon:yes gene_type:complete